MVANGLTSNVSSSHASSYEGGMGHVTQNDDRLVRDRFGGRSRARRGLGPRRLWRWRVSWRGVSPGGGLWGGFRGGGFWGGGFFCGARRGGGGVRFGAPPPGAGFLRGRRPPAVSRRG